MREFLCRKRHGSRGMSLVELLLVMAILSVVMLAVMSLYVPAHQSTVTQTQVSDVNANLRLALKVMTQDLLAAGFLVPMTPVAFPDADPDYRTLNLDSIGTENDTDFIIRSRIVGNDFARVSGVNSIGLGKFELTLSDADMPGNFPEGSRVRLFEPIQSVEIKNTSGTDQERAYPVLAPTGGNKITIDTSAISPAFVLTDIPTETVVVRIKNENQPPLQTIRYRVEDGALIRDINDEPQVLARNVDTVDFDYSLTPQGRVNRIEITLTGKTRALKDDAISGEKTRQIKTSVMLRNIH